MWTYRPTDAAAVTQRRETNAPVSAPVVKEQRAPQVQRGIPQAQPRVSRADELPHSNSAFSSASVAEEPKMNLRPRTASKPASLRTASVMGCLYLCGLAAGSVCSRILQEPLLTYARYFTSIDLGLRTAGNGAMVFSVGFLSLFCQLTLVLIAGFCVLGIGLLPVTMLLKGAGAGVFTALLYQELGAAKGLLLQALVFWLPEVLGSLFVIMLSSSALQVSCGLLRCCLGHNGAGLRTASRRLIHRYLAVCFASMLVCGLSVILTLIFGRLF